MHLTAIERAFGRIFAVVVVLFVLEFWFSSAALSGQRPGSVAVTLLLSLLLVGQGARALRRPPTQRDLDGLALATGILLPAAWLLAAPASPFLVNAAYLLVGPAAMAWAAFSRRLVVPVPVLLIVLATGGWQHGAVLAPEQAATTAATVIFAGVAARLMRAGARRADASAELLSRRMAGQAAAQATEEAERRAANAVHDDVLSVLRAVSVAGPALPWGVLVSKARRAQAALGRQPSGGAGFGGLGPALKRQAAEEYAAGLDVPGFEAPGFEVPGFNVHCDISGDLDIPPDVTEALRAAAAEALRNAAAYAGTGSAQLTARGDGAGGVTVTVSDTGTGFEPAQVGPASTGLRSSIQGRLADAGGNAEVISAPGQGTTIVLTWRPPPPAGRDVDPLDWGRRLAPPPMLVFLGFILPQQLSSLTLLSLRGQDLRWPGAGVAAFAGLFVLTAAMARNVSRMRMSLRLAAFLVIAVTALVTVGTLAVAHGTTDAFAYWIAGQSSTLIGIIVLLRGPAAGLVALALDLAALTAGLLAAGPVMSGGGWVGILASPVLGAGGGAGFLAGFRSLSTSTERQLAEYGERLRSQARAAAMSRADSAALEHARRVAGPVLSQLASGLPRSAALRTAAELAGATLRDELLAPGFLTAALAGRVRAARTSGAQVTVNTSRHDDTALTGAARELLAAALARIDAVAEVTLHLHPPAEGQPALLIGHVRSRPGPDHAALRDCAARCGALVSDLGDEELLVRLQAAR